MSLVDAIRTRLPSGTRWSGPFVVSIVLVAMAGAELVEGLSSIGAAWFAPQPPTTEDPLLPMLSESKEFKELCVRRVDGRSLFTPPSPPPRPAPPTPPPAPPPPPPPPPPAPVVPTTYTGPKLTGLLPTGVIFEGKPPVRVGESSGGVKVLAIIDARHVRVAHAGGEYDVTLTMGPSLESLSQPWRTAGMPDGGASTGIRLHADQPAGDPEANAETPGPAGTVDPEAAAAAAAAAAEHPDPNAAEPVPGTEEPDAAADAAPGSMTEESVAAMSREEIAKALMRINDAKKDPQLAPADRSRLDHDQQLLITQLRKQP